MTKDPHASLDRPMATPLRGGLPPEAIPYGTYTPWEVVILRIHRNPGVWFELRTHYKHPGSAVSSARAAAAKMLSAEEAAALKFSSSENDDGTYTVYLRFEVPETRIIDLRP